MDDFPFLRIAHRAGNTPAQLAQVLTTDAANAIEFDVRLARGVFVARHAIRMGPLWSDGVGPCGERKPRWWDRLRRTIAPKPFWKEISLEEQLRLVPHERFPYLDLKNEILPHDRKRYTEKLIALVDKNGFGSRAIFCSRDWKLLDCIRGMQPSSLTFYSIETERELAKFLQRYGNEQGITGVVLSYYLLLGSFGPHRICALRSRGLLCIAATINDPVIHSWQLYSVPIVGYSSAGSSGMPVFAHKNIAQHLKRNFVSGIVSDDFTILASVAD